MDWQAWFTLAVVLVAMAALATERFSAPYVIIAAVTVLLISGVITSSQALSGFSSDTPVSIAALYVMAGAAELTGALDRLTMLAVGRRDRRPGQRRATSTELARVLAPTSLISAFIYNTPTTTMVAPQVASWARRTGRSSSWYLMALNGAVLVGGLCTSIGTTTNVVVTGLLQSAHMRGLSLFEMSPVGIPIALVGLALIIPLAPRLVPGRSSPTDRASANDVRQYTVEMVVSPVLADRTVAEAGLRNLDGVYLVAIDRSGHVVTPVAPSHVLAAGDRLTFAGNIETVLDLQRLPGLVSAEHPHFAVVGDNTERRFYEVVVAAGSPVVGGTLKEIGFRERYQAAVVAVHREGERLGGKLGSLRLRAGDVLLLLAPPGFRRRWRGSGDFALIAPMDGSGPVRREKAPLVWLVIAGFLTLVTLQVLSLLEVSLIAALALVALRVVSAQEARSAVDLNVVIVLAASFGLGAAISKSGLGKEAAKLLVHAFGGMGSIGVLGAVLICTLIITQVVTNNATAILMFPIALAAAHQIHANPRAFAIAVAVGASCSFLTPIGYQTNMIVYGMGGYRFRDFVPLGLVLAVSTAAIALVTIPAFFPLHAGGH